MSKFSKGSEFMCISLELVNCNQADRTSAGMTLFSCVLQKKREDSVIKMRQFLNEYIRACTVSGLAGFFVKSGDSWVHWRWAILGICADSVAEQQIIGEANKMHSMKPCIDSECERRVFNPIEYGYTNADERRVISSNKEFLVLGQALDAFPERSAFRLMSVIAHGGDAYRLVQQVKETIPLTSRQIRSLDCMKRFFQRFPRYKIKQWMPILISKRKMKKWREKQLSRVLSDGDVKRYMMVKERVRGDDLHPEERLLVSPKICFVKDMMHFVGNVCFGFLSYLSCNSLRTLSKEEKLFDKVVNQYLYGTSDSSTSFCRSDKSIIEMAAKRLDALHVPSEFSWINSMMLQSGYYKHQRTHDCMLFSFAIFSYAFQDSMNNPAVMGMKTILDVLSYMYNFDGDIEELIYTQSVMNFFEGLLEGEVAPSWITPSMHAVIHIGKSVLCHGPPAVNNCLNQESLYKLLKKNVMNSPNPEKTAQTRLLASTLVSIHQLSHEEEETGSVLEELTSEESSGFISRLDSSIYQEMTSRGLFEDSFFYRSDCLPIETTLDRIVPCIRNGATKEAILQTIRQTSVPLLDEHFIPSTLQVGSIFKKYRHGGRTTTADPQLSFNCKKDTRRLGFLRLFDGSVACFLVVGFTVDHFDEHPLYQALCVYIPTHTASSFLETQHYAMLDTSVNATICDSVIIPVSLNRLILNHTLILPFSWGDSLLYCVAYMKLCIRQCRRMKKSILFEQLLKAIQ